MTFYRFSKDNGFIERNETELFKPWSSRDKQLMNKINAYLCSIFSAVNFKLSCSRLLSTIKLFQDLAEFI
ncbi:MAG: hypothetical protein CL912_03235 [Deltaproteobacteria bacterium]|jgi:hypothetical protein|nr:hypothetical protein [Deltaproteobacteria bacterium]